MRAVVLTTGAGGCSVKSTTVKQLENVVLATVPQFAGIIALFFVKVPCSSILKLLLKPHSCL